MSPGSRPDEADNESLDFDQRCTGWLARIAERDEPAFEAFYAETLANVYGVALRICRDHAAAEEVVTDVFHQVWLQAGRFDPQRGRPIVWVLSISRSRALDYLRKEVRARRARETADRDDEAYIDEDLFEAIDDRSRVGSLMATLSAVQRDVLLLAYFRDFSQKRISEHLDIPLGTVKSHVRRALQTMREGLASEVA